MSKVILKITILAHKIHLLHTGSRTILVGLVIPFQIAPIIYIHKLDNQVQKSTENTTILTQ